MARSDPEALVREHGAFLRRLARELARGGGGDGREGDAEDLVQETWVQALRRPPDPARPARPWLAEVLRNLWRMRHRGAGRREAREADAQAMRDAPLDPEQALSRAETLALLSDRLSRLAEPLRTTLLLRYGEGMSAAAIAALQSIPAGTVRWRLKTALDALRADLDETRGPSWVGAFLIPAGTSSTSAGPAAVPLGGLLMKKWIAAAIVLLLMIGAGLWWRRSQSPGAARGAVTGTTNASAGFAAAGDPRAGAGRGAESGRGANTDAPGDAPGAPLADPGRAAVVAPDPSPTGAFAGRVINWSTGRGVPSAELVFDGEPGAITARADAEGRFTIIPPSAAPLTLATVAAAGFLPYAPEWGHSPVRLVGSPGRRVDGVTIFLFPALDYGGLVLDPSGQPVAGAVVRLLGTPAGEQASDALPDRFVTDARGRFTFHAPDDTLFEARAAGFGPGRARLDGAVSLTRELVIRLGPPSSGAGLGLARLAGRVVDGAGLPVPGALVRALPAIARRGPEAGAPPMAPPGFDVAGPDGAFQLDGLDPIVYQVTASDGERAPVVVEAPAGKTDLRLAFSAGATLAGRVVDADGAPVPTFTVALLRPEGLRREPVTSRSVMDPAGRFAIENVPPGELVVTAAARGLAPSDEVRARVPESGRAEVTVTVPAGGVIRGVVTGAGGEPLTWARVMVEGPGGGASVAPVNAGTVTDDRGEFTLTGVAPGRTTLSVAAGGHHPKLVGGLEVRAGAALGPIAVTLVPLRPGEEPRLELVGVGLKLGPDGDTLLVQDVIPGGGAAAAGIVPGDRLAAVDGAGVAQLGFDGALARIRGAEGTTVVLGLLRAGGATAELVVTRRKISATP